MHKESPRNPLPNIPVIYAAVVVWIYYFIQIKGGVRLTCIRCCVLAEPSFR